MSAEPCGEGLSQTNEALCLDYLPKIKLVQEKWSGKKIKKTSL